MHQFGRNKGMRTDSIKLVDEHDGGCSLARLGKKVTHAGCTAPDKELHKLARAAGEEGHPGLSRHSFCCSQPVHVLALQEIVIQSESSNKCNPSNSDDCISMLSRHLVFISMTFVTAFEGPVPCRQRNQLPKICTLAFEQSLGKGQNLRCTHAATD
jgi:hypothetical protein